MDTFELNKIAGAILGAILFILVTNQIGDLLVHPVIPEKSVLNIDTGASEAAKKAEPAKKTPPLAVLLASADAKKGATISKKCHACHNFEKGSGNKVGPDLYSVVGRDVASMDFSYSSELKSLGGKWTYERLFHFIQSPKKFAPGTKMTFAGLKKPTDRADLLLYLRSNGDNPPPLPKP